MKLLLIFEKENILESRQLSTVKFLLFHFKKMLKNDKIEGENIKNLLKCIWKVWYVEVCDHCLQKFVVNNHEYYDRYSEFSNSFVKNVNISLMKMTRKSIIWIQIIDKCRIETHNNSDC